MKKIIQILILLLSINISSAQLPIKFKVDKQSMSTPMTPIYDIFFGASYHTRPVNISFDGEILNMFYDNGSTFKKLNLILIDKNDFRDDGVVEYERFIYVDKNNMSDTIIHEIGYLVGYTKIILPTKSKSGEYVGYTSYTEYNEKYKKDMVEYLTYN